MGKKKKKVALQQRVSLLSDTTPSSSPSTFWIPRVLGLSVFAGLSLMRYYYSWGVLIVYVGILFLLYEVCVEPWLLKRPLPIQVCLIAVVLLLCDVFSIGIVGAQAPINFQSYAMRKGDYSPGTTIAGIAWDSHLTDLRVTLTNPTNDDYENLDVAVQPDKWTYKAGLLNSPGCDLLQMGGDTVSIVRSAKGGATSITSIRVGTGFDFQDNVGDVFIPLATKLGYRVRCTKLSAHFTVQIVFAVVSVYPELLKETGAVGKKLDPGNWGMGYAELHGAKSEFDVLDVRPSPSVVQLSGEYIRKLKPFTITETVAVDNGN
jgi:hypothetical protein